MSTINKIIQPITNKIPESNRLERIWKLAQVDFKKRYYNDRLGLLWALLNPIFQIAVYYYVFTQILKMDRIENYAIFLFCGLVVWLGFKEASTKGISMIRTKRYLIENIQFNQVDLFVSSTISVFMGIAFNTMALIIACVISGVGLSINLIYIPIIYINLFLISMGVAMILATIKIYLDDIVHLWTMITLVGFWTSGIFIRGELFLEQAPFLLYLHPFIGIIINMRNVTMYGLQPDFYMLSVTMIAGIVILLFGIFVYKKNAHKAIENL
jgi:ABC-type polysaccharide/polyol phosphate export permease